MTDQEIKPYKKCLVARCYKTKWPRSPKYCSTHAVRFYKTGKLSIKPKLTIKEKFERYMGKKDKNDCMNWLSSIMYRGYGTFGRRIKGKPVKFRAHRFSYQLYKGKIPKGMLVCHSCDNRKCVNPDHLFLGTAKDNTQDMINKNRNNCGGRKLTIKKVLSIRKLHNHGISQAKIAKIFKISQPNIWSIVTNKTWKNITNNTRAGEK